MEKNVFWNGVGALVFLALVIWGLSAYGKNQKSSVSESVSPPASEQVSDSTSNVSVDSTGGKLTVTETPITGEDKNKNMNKATIDTNFGKIVLEFYRNDAPKAVENFVTLAQKGFYNGLIFHRVIPGFMIQGGDPLGVGTGGPGYQFADELDPNTASAKAGYKKGILAMANAGPNTNGSQFFIMLADYPLPHNYTIFGRVISGQDVVDKIGKTPTGSNDRPLTPVVMKSVTVSE